MLPAGCPAWDYATHPDCKTLLPAAAANVLAGIASGSYVFDRCARDTRPMHKELFTKLWPNGHAYYVGNYRGLVSKKCLKDYPIGVIGDPMVGVPPAQVLDQITKLGDAIVRVADTLKAQLQSATQAATSQPIKTVAIVKLACSALVSFLTIHPYANGNGHIGRALLFVVLRHFGYVPNKWTIDPRPPFPTYLEMIARYRRGDVNPLEQFVLSCISSAPTSMPFSAPPRIS